MEKEYMSDTSANWSRNHMILRNSTANLLPRQAIVFHKYSSAFNGSKADDWELVCGIVEMLNTTGEYGLLNSEKQSRSTGFD